jgi:hypothetical protein
MKGEITERLSQTHKAILWFKPATNPTKIVVGSEWVALFWFAQTTPGKCVSFKIAR